VLASSIAATGCLDNDFVPQQLPIPDEHPCLARDAYGLSKSLMEEMVHYFARVQPETDWTLLRFGAVFDEAKFTAPATRAGDALNIPFTLMAQVGCSDVLRAVELALDSSHTGVRTYNVVAPDATCADTPRAILHGQFGERLSHIDWSHYEQPRHAHDALYAMKKIREELGFVPQFATRYQEAEETP
jgi:UDP-glucose 4-epimerase